MVTDGNTELITRFQTEIENGNTFYTDLNGLNMAKRATRFERH
jgi:hypothetical protein